MRMAVVSCFTLLRQRVSCALDLAFASAGRSRAARIAIMAMTTKSSINVNPEGRERFIQVDGKSLQRTGARIPDVGGLIINRILGQRLRGRNVGARPYRCAFQGTGDKLQIPSSKHQRSTK